MLNLFQSVEPMVIKTDLIGIEFENFVDAKLEQQSWTLLKTEATYFLLYFSGFVHLREYSFRVASSMRSDLNH